jgi:formate dehydrogenase subunit delta
VNVDRLVAMANDIAAFFAAESDRAAGAAAVSNHLRRYWEPRMRREIVAHYQSGGMGLTELAAAGVAHLAEQV